MTPANSLVMRESDRTALPDPTFEAVYAEHFGFVWRCLRVLGVAQATLDDAAQDVFMVVHRRLADFRGESSLRTWLYAIVRHVAANQRRSQRRRPSDPLPDIELPSHAPGPHEQVAARDAANFIRDFLAKLDEPKREVFVLAMLEELSVAEVAEILHVPVNTAYTRLRSVRLEFHRALQRKRSQP